MGEEATAVAPEAGIGLGASAAVAATARESTARIAMREWRRALELTNAIRILGLGFFWRFLVKILGFLLSLFWVEENGRGEQGVL